MAYFDRAQAAHEELIKEKFDELKLSLKTLDSDGKVHPYNMALDYIIHMEHEISDLKKRVLEYQNFFTLLSKFLPKSNIHTIYG